MTSAAHPLEPDLAQDLDALRATFRERGFYERPFMRTLAVYFGTLVLRAVAIWVVVAATAPALRLAAFLFAALAAVSLATTAHTASHSALSRSRFWNRFLFYFTYPFQLQLSARYWRHSHVEVHHPAPNIVGLDDDCDLRPTFAINDQHRAGANLWQRFRWSVQGLTFFLLLPGNGLNIQRQAWARLLKELCTPALRTREAWLDLGCMLAHLALFLFLPMAFFPAQGVLLLYLTQNSLIGILLFAVLAPGHFPAEASCLDRDQRERGNFYLRQTAATVNFRTGPLGRWLCSGLQYQIEHHLFPGISHVHFREMSPLVRAFCQRNGLPYRTLGWGEAVWKSYRVFLHPKQVVSLRELGYDGQAASRTSITDGSSD